MMDKKKLDRLERKVLRRDAQQAVRNIKKEKLKQKRETAKKADSQ